MDRHRRAGASGNIATVEPYRAGVAVGRPRSLKTALQSRMVVVLDTRRESRALQLIHPQTRCIRAGDVHELIVTDEMECRPGDQVNHVVGIGFAAFDSSGVIMVGDAVHSAQHGLLGTIGGFDESHAPNHFNIVLKHETRRTGRELGLQLDEAIVISGRTEWEGPESR